MLLCLAGNICFLFLQHTSVLLYIIFHPFHYMHYTPNTFLNRVLIVWTWSLERCSVSEKGVFPWTCSRWHLKGFFECTVAIRQAGVGAEAGASPSLSTRHCKPRYWGKSNSPGQGRKRQKGGGRHSQGVQQEARSKSRQHKATITVQQIEHFQKGQLLLSHQLCLYYDSKTLKIFPVDFFIIRC